MAAHWPTLERLGLAAGASPDRLRFDADLADGAWPTPTSCRRTARSGSDVKHALFAALDAAARPDVILASSSSGLLPSAIAAAAARRTRSGW